MLKKSLQGIRYILILLGLLVIVIIPTARAIKKHQIRITNKNGVEESLYLNIGGAKQYIQIRGEDQTNPVILVLHGGPGSPISYFSHYWQNDLENEFTVVQWDQRGSGRTYYANDKRTTDAPTTERLLSDLDEIVTYLTDRFNQKGIILLGHSWGTVLGVRYTQLNPEKVRAYIGVSQIVDSIKAELVSAQQAIQLAKSSDGEGSAEDIVLAYGQFKEGSFDFGKLRTLRTLTSKHLPKGESMSALGQIWLGATSPQMGLADLRWYLYPMHDFTGFIETNQMLFEQLFANDGFNIFNYQTGYDVPVYFISGDSDWITPYTMVEEYYEVIKAPMKEMVLIGNAGHTPFLDKPAEFCDAIRALLKL